MHTGIVHSIDFSAEGKRLHHVGIPFSVDRSPYFQVQVPVCTIRNCDGPSLLLLAGNHGDEYEGELSLARLIRRLDPARMCGAVTIIPIANRPAVMAGKRCSPLDGGNLNRAFPGSASGSPTQRLAHWLETDVLPRHHVLFDLHSGGTSMAHLPTALIERNDDSEAHARAVSLMVGLGLAHAFIADNGPAAPTSMGAARRAGIIGLSGEFGGGGTVTPQTMATTAAAIDAMLIALGIVGEPVLSDRLPARSQTRLLSLQRHSQAIYATRRGWFEPAVSLGDEVDAGALAGWYHDLERLEASEEPLVFQEGGVVISCRLHTMAEAGDCLMQVAQPVGMA